MTSRPRLLFLASSLLTGFVVIALFGPLPFSAFFAKPADHLVLPECNSEIGKTLLKDAIEGAPDALKVFDVDDVSDISVETTIKQCLATVRTNGGTLRVHHSIELISEGRVYLNVINAWQK